jgi:3-oxoacyl-[acyl-carrier protein] reductase
MTSKKIRRTDSARPVALVTGGTRGIGKAIVEQLLRDGFFVIVNHRRTNGDTRKMKSQLQKASSHLHFFEADVSDEKSVRDAFRKIKKEFKVIDVVVSNAGIINNRTDETIGNISLSTLHRMIGVNFFGGIHILKEALPLMKRSSRGRIIFINSALSFIGTGRRFGYTTSKTVNVVTVRALALELAPWNICVNAVVPGYIKTRMYSFKGKELEAKLQKIPLGRLGSPEEVAHLVSFLCSAQSNYITGQHIHINGGLFFS